MTEGLHIRDMTDGPRALLTPRERDALRGDEDMTDDTRRSLLGRVRAKVAHKLRKDVEIIRENDEELAALLHEAVCEEETEERLEALEEEIDEIRQRLDDTDDENDS